MKNTTAALLLLAASASADEVILPNGARIRGDVREENDQVVVRLDVGTMSFPKSQVRIVRSASEPQRELDARTEKAATAQDFHDAAVFAKSHGLDRRVEELHRRAVELDPEHEGSRSALGYAKVEGRWLKGDALFDALGYVKRGAHWVTKETAGTIDARLAEEEKARAEERAMRADEARAAEKARAEDIQRANHAFEEARRVEEKRQGLVAALEFEKLALERRRLEIEREVALKTAASATVLPYPAATGFQGMPYPGHDRGCGAPGTPNCCSRPWYYTVDRRGAGPAIRGPR